MMSVRRLTLTGLLALSAMLTLVASPAGARTTRLAQFDLAPELGFIHPTGVAIDQETGNVYVLDNDAAVIDVFGREGGPPADEVPSTISSPEFSFRAATSGQGVGVAVDNACYFQHKSGKECEEYDPSNSDVYVANVGGGALDKLRLNKVTHGYEIVQSFSFREPTGVAVDEQGNVYIVNPPERAITELTRGGGEVKIEQNAIADPGYVAVGAPGVVYVGGEGEEGSAEGQGVAKLVVNASDEGEPQPLGGEGRVEGGPIAVDSDGDAFVDNRNGIEEYDSSGNLIGAFEFDREKQIYGEAGLAVNDETGSLALGNLIYGPPVSQPEPIVAPASPIERTAATLNGTVIPEEEEAEYHFEYGPCSEGVSSCGADDYPLETATEKIGPATVGEALHVEAAVSGLTPATAYHFRLVAVAAHDRAPQLTSAEEAFTTLPAVKGVGQCGATAPGGTAATLEAPLEPEAGELPVKYSFEYGTSVPSHTAEPYEHQTGVKELKEVAEVGVVKAEALGLAPNTTYDCRLVASENAGNETVGANGTFKTKALVPVVEGSSAAPGPIPRKIELLSGAIDPEHSPTAYQFAYIDQAGHEAGYPMTLTPEASAGEGLGGKAVGPVQIEGLKAGTTYRYRLIATNKEGPEYGPEETFTTAPRTPPVVQSATASAVTQMGATISVTVDSQELPTGWELELATAVSCPVGQNVCSGAEASYNGASVFGTLSPGQDAVTVDLEGLMPATTYHVRLVATNEDGTEYGPDETFTTPGIPSPLTQPVAPPLLATPDIPFPTEAAIKQLLKHTRAQKLTGALKACKGKPKKRRAACERQAHRKYEPVKAKSKSKGKS